MGSILISVEVEVVVVLRLPNEKLNESNLMKLGDFDATLRLLCK
jgi:hypothetical protein